MKRCMFVAVAVFSLAAGNLLAGDISPDSLAKMGLAGVKRMSDQQGKQVRGSGTSASFGGFAFAFGATPQAYSGHASGANAVLVTGLGSFSFGGAGAIAK